MRALKSLAFAVAALSLALSPATGQAAFALRSSEPHAVSAALDPNGAEAAGATTPLLLDVVGRYGGDATSVAVSPDGAVAFVGSGQTVVALDLHSGPEPIQLGATRLLPGEILDLAVKGQTVYAVVQREGLYVIDAANPADPVLVGFYASSALLGATVAGNYLYLGNGGLTILDISRPRRPVQVGHLDLPGYARGVAVAGSYAYVATSDSLKIVNIADPRTPSEIGSVGVLGSWSVALFDRYAYVTRVEYGFDVIDVANPSTPVVVGGVQLGYTYDIALRSQSLFVVGSGGLRTFNVANSTQPVMTGIFNTRNQSVGLALFNNRAYLAARSDGFFELDVAGLVTIKELGHTDTPGRAEGLSIAGGFAYVADGSEGLRVLSLTDPLRPTEVGHLDTPALARSVFVAGNRAYVAEMVDYNAGVQGGLSVVDITVPTQPVQLGRIQTPDSAMDVVVRGNLAYVAARDAGLRIINVANAANPQALGVLDTPGSAQDVSVAVQGANVIAFVADTYYGIRIVDVTSPAQPAEISHFPQNEGGAWTGVAVRGNYVYATNAVGSRSTDGLYMIDISNVADPQWVSFAPATGAVGVVLLNDRAYVYGMQLVVLGLIDPLHPVELGAYAVTGPAVVNNGLAYVAAGNDGIRVINVSNLAVPVEQASWRVESAVDLAMTGTYGLLTGAESLRVLNLADPRQPSLVRSLATSAPTNRIVTANNYAYVTQQAKLDFDLNASSGGGLRVYGVSNPSVPTDLGFFPTPDGLGLGSLAVIGRYVYAIGVRPYTFDQRLYVIDVADPQAPIQVGVYTAPSGIVDMVAQGQYAYLVTEDATLRVLGLSDPIQPTEVGSLALPDTARALTVADGVAYVGFVDSNTGLQIVDVANPNQPGLIGALPGVREVSALRVSNHRLFTAGFVQLLAFDLAGNAGPIQQVGQLRLRSFRPEGMAVSGNVVYLPDHEGGLFVINAAPATHRLVLPLIHRSY